MQYTLTIPGEPIHQKRAKFANRGKFVQVYNPCAKQKIDIKTFIKSLWKGDVIDGPVIVDVEFQTAIPQSWSKKKRKAMVGKPNQSKPDIDNFLVFIYNAMTEIVYVDDRLIWKQSSCKIYSENPQTIIRIDDQKSSEENASAAGPSLEGNEERCLFDASAEERV